MKKDFELKEEHILLLQNMYWETDGESSAPAVNGKRPYGNSNVAPDIAEILGVELPDSGNERECDDVANELCRIHYGTTTAIQVILQTKSFKPGLYKDVSKPGYQPKWQRVK